MSNTDEPDDYSIPALVHWLNAKYRRHGEIEDKAAADALTAQAATIERLEAENVRLQPLADEWARLSQDEGKAEREIERLRSDTVRWIAFRRIWPDDESEYDMFFNALAVAKNPDEVDAAIDAAMQAGKATEPHDNRKCSKPKCNGNMRPGTYLAQTMSGVPDFPGDTHAVTVSPAGPGRLAECIKCDSCGWSVTGGKAVES